MAAAAPRSAGPSATPKPPPLDIGLHGKYKEFFRPEHHPAVLDWFHAQATEKQRRSFKRFVKDILAFDAVAAKASLHTMEERDYAAAAAIVSTHAAGVVQERHHESCVAYLSFASIADRQAFREVFGTILPISKTWSYTQTKTDFAPGTKFMKGEKMHRDESKPMLGKSLLKPPSAAVEAPCEIIGHGRSAYGTTFAWKVGKPLSANVVQRAHDASFTGAPWGLYGHGSNQSQYTPQTLEDFAESMYSKAPDGGGGGKRRFCNYNENVTHAMYRGAKLAKQHRVPLSRDTMVETVEALPTPRKVPVMTVAGGLVLADDRSDATPPGRGGHQAAHVMMVPKKGSRKLPVERELIDVKQQSVPVSPIFCR